MSVNQPEAKSFGMQLAILGVEAVLVAVAIGGMVMGWDDFRIRFVGLLACVAIVGVVRWTGVTALSVFRQKESKLG